jgi:transketolase
VAWEVAVSRKTGPVALVLTRQKLPVIDRNKFAPADSLKNGGYILADASNKRPELILMGSGSEVSLCLQAREKLESGGISTRVVSLPCWELFEEQTQEYRDQVLPPEIATRISVEAASPFGWIRYIGTRGIAIGMTTFGASAPGEVNMEKFGFTVENILSHAHSLLRK